MEALTSAQKAAIIISSIGTENADDLVAALEAAFKAVW